MNEPASKATYLPGVFLRPNIEAAKEIILGQCGKLTIEERWKLETAWLIEKFRSEFNSQQTLMDYGCGIGRIAKELPNPVFGVDMSITMREQSIRYTLKEFYSITTPIMLDRLSNNGLKFRGAYSIWCLQHVMNPAHDINLIANCLHPRAKFVVVNLPNRCVPVTDGKTNFWADDQVDLDIELNKRFKMIKRELVPDYLVEFPSYYTLWQCKGGVS